MNTFSNKCLLSKLQKTASASKKSISSVTANAQIVRHLSLHKLADVSWNWQSTCAFRLVVNRSRFSSALTSVLGCPVAISSDSTSQALNSKHDGQADWYPGYLVAWSLCWTVSCKPLLIHFCSVRRRSILLENKPLAKQLVTVVQ